MADRAHYSTASRVALVIGILLALAECWHLTHRVASRQTDFSVFYRSAQELVGGVDAEFYRRLDQTGLYHCIPPSGTMLLFWMPWTSMQVAAALWSLLNLAVLALSVWALHAVFAGLDRQRRLYQSTWLWAVFLLLVMSSGSLQVGQYSVLFASCWIFYLWADATNRHALAALLLALPTTIKFYPGLLFAIPATLRRFRQLACLLPAIILLAVILPLPLYGSHLSEMWHGFFTHIIFGDANRVQAGLRPESLSNQSLDVVLLRYLTFQPIFHQANPWFPHASLPQTLVALISNLLKLGALVLTALASVRLSTQALRRPRWTALLLMALWTATLYLVMLEVRARYAVYPFPAFLPLLVMAAAQRHNLKRYVGWCTFIALTVAAVLQFAPDSVRMLGPSVIAIVAVWAVLLRCAWLSHTRFLGPANTIAAETTEVHTA